MTTYVFGAGASRDVGYPLASDMGDGLLGFMLNSPDGGSAQHSLSEGCLSDNNVDSAGEIILCCTDGEQRNGLEVLGNEMLVLTFQRCNQ